MRHRNIGKQLSRNTAHRIAMRRNLASSVFEHGSVRTTVVKAKEIRPFVERLITIARQGTLAARRQVVSLINDRAMTDPKDRDALLDKSVVQKLFEEIAPRYADRPGGYTRIIHIPERRIGDAGKQVILQLVEPTTAAAPSGGASSTASRRRKRAAKRAEAARSSPKASESPAETAPTDASGDEKASPQ